MVHRKVRGLALITIGIVSVTSFVGLGAAGASATAMTTTHPSHVTVITTGAATAASSWFYIEEGDGQCVGIKGAAIEAPAVQWKCEAVPNQEWNWGYSLSGFPEYRQLVNNENPHQCLGIQGKSGVPGADAYGWDCNTADLDQYWYYNGEPNENLINFNSTLYLGVAGRSVTPGANLVQWTPDGLYDQQWTFLLENS